MERDLRRLRRNPLTILSVIVLPLAYLLILGNSLQGPLEGLRLGFVALDDGKQSRDLVAALRAIAAGPRTIVLVPVAGSEEGMAMIRARKLSGLLVIPDGYSRDVEMGVRGRLGLFVDNVDGVAAGALVTAVQGALAASGDRVTRLDQPVGPPEVRAEEIYPRVDYDASLIPGVVVMAIFMGSLISGGFNLVLDRFLGVHESYLSTPLRKIDIAAGVLASGVLVTVVSSGIVFGLGIVITGARVHGGLAGLLAAGGVMLLTSIGLLAMMMALLGRANHPRIVGVVGGFLNVILFFPSGALYPVESFPVWLRAFARVNPETYAVAALKSVLFRGTGVSPSEIAYLAGFAAFMLLVATVTLKRRL